WRREAPAAPTSLLHFDECAIAMTAEIKLRRSRGWPRHITHPTVSLGRAPQGHVERAPRSYASATGRSTACSRFLRWKRLLLVAGGLVTKCTSRKDSLSVRRCPVGGSRLAGAAAISSGSGGDRFAVIADPCPHPA